MSLQDPLCELPPEPRDECCDPPEPPPAAPVVIYNPPGLTALSYRIGTFTSFRRAMLNRVAKVDLLGTTPNPFLKWREGSDGDYHTLFVELWAYLGDILTFYQERIANEAYLPTATQRDSLAQLAALINYRPAPGAAASTLLAFTVAKGKTVSIPAGFRASSKAAPGKPAAVFETSAALTALGEHSAIPLSAVAPTNQFAQLSDFQLFLGNYAYDSSALQAVAQNLYGSAASTLLHSFTFSAAAPMLTLSEFILPAYFYYQPYVSQTSRQIVLQGTNNRLAVGDYVLSVENEGAAGEKTTLHQITQVSPDKPSNTTTIAWSEATGTTYNKSSGKEVNLYALRVTAAPFGSNAPDWSSLPKNLTGTVNGVDGPYKSKSWDTSGNAWSFVPTPGDSANMLFLDSVYEAIKSTPDNPGWVALLTDGQDPQILHVTDARPISKIAYTLTSRVTRLTFRSGDNVKSSTFPLRQTTILAGSELLTLQNNLPLPAQVSGDVLMLAGQLPKLAAGQTLVMRGSLYDSASGGPSSASSAEAVTLKTAPVIDAANNLTTVTLTKPLGATYVRAGSVLLANVVAATQGETVRDEVLGSSSGGPFQAFPLKQKPLTYLPATDAEGLAAVQSTLLVSVNGVLWAEQTTLLESLPNAQDYTTTQDDNSQTTVTFGDGINGARPPTGRDNIHARYRKGLGIAGNVSADGVQQMIDSTPGLQSVTNPQVASGGADRENPAQIRQNAPASVRTFGRAVSAPDYAALALSFPGFAKASAVWMVRDPLTLQAIPHPYIQLTLASSDQTPLNQNTVLAGKLRAYLDARRDPNVPLRIFDFQPVYIDVAATIDIDARYPRQATLNNVLAALYPGLNADDSAGYFAFERLDFGQNIHLSAVYAALQAVPGVSDALITTFRRLSAPADTDPNTVRDNIFIRPTELAMIKNDPADTNNQYGKLVISLGKGGFADT
jgi:predicted phage baseplate assembly protein